MRRLLACLVLAAATLPLAATPVSTPLRFTDVQRDTAKFMGWHRSITLTAPQEAVKRAALEAVPAPCCSDNSAYTCCCPCNLSKTLWGLSNYVIAKKGVNAAQLKEVVDAWMSAAGPSGYSGDSCYQGGCEREFHNNGCGGMDESKLSV